MFLMLFLLIIASLEAKPKLIDYKNNVYSQFGEDGIIEKIFETMGVESKVAIEFGAYDGFSLSNTANLWTKDHQWKGILIEADKNLYNAMVRNVASYNCIPIHRKVGISAHDSLETILKEHTLMGPVDLLSIDIDGDDYYIFKSLTTLHPRVIICEYNPSIPAHFDIYTDYQGSLGCSVAALQRIAGEKGYTLVAITDTNCFFVINEEYHKFENFVTDRENIRIDRYIAYIMSDYKCCYKVIATKDFRDPWGWQGCPSEEIYHGDYTYINANIKR